jgi:hypothetical protein
MRLKETEPRLNSVLATSEVGVEIREFHFRVGCMCGYDVRQA